MTPMAPAPGGPDGAVPGGVYLCRIGEGLSCGACCGLYNRTGVSRAALAELLARRTERFRGIPRTVAAIDAYAREEERRETAPPRWAEVYRCPFLGFTGPRRETPRWAEVYRCPFLGFTGPRRETPGCLLHPQSGGNAGVDYRGLSFYGGLACRDYFCAAYRTLKAPWKRLLRAAADDWYAYGILVSEHRLLGLFLAEAEARLGRPLDPGDEAAALPAWREFAALVVDWPWRDPSRPEPGRDPFDDGTRPRPQNDPTPPGFSSSPFALLFHELRSRFASPGEMTQAQRRMSEAVRRLAVSLRP